MEYKIKNEFEQRPLIFDNRIGKRYLSVKSLSVYLDVSEKTIRKWIEKREIPYVRLRGYNSIRFDITEIMKWISP
jgi:excisionase family DNA binding protein